MISILFAAVFAFSFNNVYCAPTSEEKGEEFTMKDAMKYLSQYKYVDSNDNDEVMASLTHEDQFTEGLKRFQEIAGVEITGELNQETIDAMKLPRCGVADNIISNNDMMSRRKKRFVAEGGRWRNRNLRYRYDSMTTDMSQEQVEYEMTRAFSVWSHNSGLTFTRVCDQYCAADIIIVFATYAHGDGNAFDGEGGVLAHAFFPAYGGDAHFDDSEPFTMNSYYGVNLFQVAAHELGHSLGLGHSNNREALMAPFYKGFQPSFRMPSDDIVGIRYLYGDPVDTNTAEPTAAPTQAPTQAPTRAPTRAPTDPPPVDDNYCMDGRFDAITTTNDGSVYGFRGSQYFKIAAQGLAAGYPRQISWDWRNRDGSQVLPDYLDTALYWPGRQGWYRHGNSWKWGRVSGQTFFFKSEYVWKFVDLQYEWTKRIDEWMTGLPFSLSAAFVWGRNGRTYFMKGQEYYRATTGSGTAVHVGYPKPLSTWWRYTSADIARQLGQKVDAAFQYGNGRTYFFSDQQYYRFNDQTFRIDQSYPRPISTWWYGCRTSSNLDDGTGSVVDLNSEIAETGPSHDDDDQKESDVSETGDMESDPVGDGSGAAGALTTRWTLLSACAAVLMSCLL